MRMGPREIIFLLVLLAVPAGSYFYVFQPRNEEIRVAQKEVEEKRTKLARLKKIRAKIESINGAIEEGQRAIELEREMHVRPPKRSGRGDAAKRGPATTSAPRRSPAE